MTALAGWENFYVIVGSSAGALIGLQFVVITLIAEVPGIRDLERAGSAFATPTVIHFGAVLLLSGVLSAPWYSVTPVRIIWGVLGLIGVVYTIIVVRRMRMQTAYAPEFEDWLFNVVLPLAAYAMLSGSAYGAGSHVRPALFVVGAAILLLLFIGVHNAWDAVTYHVYVSKREHKETERRS